MPLSTSCSLMFTLLSFSSSFFFSSTVLSPHSSLDVISDDSDISSWSSYCFLSVVHATTTTSYSSASPVFSFPSFATSLIPGLICTASWVLRLLRLASPRLLNLTYSILLPSLLWHPYWYPCSPSAPHSYIFITKSYNIHAMLIQAEISVFMTGCRHVPFICPPSSHASWRHNWVGEEENPPVF